MVFIYQEIDMDPQIIAAIGTAIIAPIIAYLKIRDERNSTSDKRETQFALLTKRLDDAEAKLDAVEHLKDAINRIDKALTKIETILEMYMKQNKS